MMTTRGQGMRLLFLLPALLLPTPGDLSAQGLSAPVRAEQEINAASAESQQRISSLARQTQDLLSEYRAVVRETESLRIYNENLQRVVSDQEAEIESINRQLGAWKRPTGASFR